MVEFIHDGKLYTEDVLRTIDIFEISTIGASLQKNQRFDDALSLYQFALNFFGDCPQRRVIVTRINKIEELPENNNTNKTIKIDKLSNNSSNTKVFNSKLRCPKCSTVTNELLNCPTCGSNLCSSYQTSANNYKKCKTRMYNIFAYMCIYAVIVCGVFDIGNNFIVVLVFAIIPMLTAIYYMMKTTWDLEGFKIELSKFNPDYTSNGIAAIASLLALGVGLELLHASVDFVTPDVDSIGHLDIDFNSHADIDAGSIPIEDTNFLGMPAYASITDSNFGNNINTNLNHVDTNIDHTSHHSTISVTDSTGMPVEHIDINGSVGHIKNNLDMTTGYITELPTHTTLIQDHLGITNFTVSGNGSIYDTHGMLQGTISKSDSMFVIKDRYGIVLSTISG